ncbi:MAG TPA: hypothetical protein H9898_07535 [Candidatus Anaerobiospirillum stercoravium]|nr:hypothetical protein [Candidatus Anaerobiospirillum stercoravium]
MAYNNQAQDPKEQKPAPQPIRSMLMTTIPYWNSQSQAFYYELSFVTIDRKTRITPEHTHDVLAKYLVQENLDKFVGPKAGVAINVQFSDAFLDFRHDINYSRMLVRLPSNQPVTPTILQQMREMSSFGMSFATDLETMIREKWLEQLPRFDYVVLDLHAPTIAKDISAVQSLKQIQPRLKMIISNVQSQKEMRVAFSLGASLVSGRGKFNPLPVCLLKPPYNASTKELFLEQRQICLLMSFMCAPRPNIQQINMLLRSSFKMWQTFNVLAKSVDTTVFFSFRSMEDIVKHFGGHGARNLIALGLAAIQYDLYNRATNLNGDQLVDYFRRLLTNAIFIESVCKLYPYFAPCRDLIFEFVIFHGLEAMVVHRPDKMFRITQDLIKPRCRFMRVLQDLVILGDSIDYLHFPNIRGVCQRYKLNDLRVIYLHEQAGVKAMKYLHDMKILR